jgi:hypothetical protein
MFVLTGGSVPGRSRALGTALHLRLISDAGPSPGAGFPHANLSRWRVRSNLASQVIDGMLADLEFGPHRIHAGAAVANPAELGRIVPPPSFRLTAPQRRRRPSLCSPFQGV